MPLVGFDTDSVSRAATLLLKMNHQNIATPLMFKWWKCCSYSNRRFGAMRGQQISQAGLCSRNLRLKKQSDESSRHGTETM